jgi:hypothetical protein
MGRSTSRILLRGCGFWAFVTTVLFVTCAVRTPAAQAAVWNGVDPVAAPGQAFVVVDTARNRLTLYEAGVPVRIWSVGLGKPDTPTPIGEWVVTDKQRGWGDGFGTRWLRISVPWGIYGIHGTNKPHLIGGDVSSGCIRMRNQDVEALYPKVRIGTPVLIEGNPLCDGRRLELGHIGSDVWLVQDRLARLGFYEGPCDGRFGFETEKAVKAFEAAHHLTVDGVVNLAVYQALGLAE